MPSWSEILLMAVVLTWRPPSQTTTCLAAQRHWLWQTPWRVITLHDLVVEVTCRRSRPSLSSLTVWSACCFTFFLSRLDLHWISVNKPEKNKHRDLTNHRKYCWVCGHETWPWTGNVSSASLSFFICKIGIISTLHGFVFIKCYVIF